MLNDPKPLSKSELNILKSIDVDKEIGRWAEEVAALQLPHTSTFEWNPFRPTGAIHASSITNSCLMFMYLERMGAAYKPKVPSRQRRIYDTGVVIHEQLHYYQATRAKYHGYDYCKEVAFVADELHLRGSADGMTLGWPLDRALLWEYKTINKHGISALRKPSRNYIMQIHVYMKCLGVPACMLTYWVKDTSDPHSFLIQYDRAVWKEIQGILDRIEEFVDDDSEPPRSVSSTCRYCSMLNECGAEPPKYGGHAPEF